MSYTYQLDKMPKIASKAHFESQIESLKCKMVVFDRFSSLFETWKLHSRPDLKEPIQSGPEIDLGRGKWRKYDCLSDIYE